MNTKVYRIVLIISAIIISTIMYIAYKENTQVEAKTINENNNTNEYMYYLKEYNKKIGIYKFNESEPFDLVDVYISSLPYADQSELKTGILVKDKEKLNMIIEDYES